MSERPQNKHLRPFKPGQSGNPGGKPKQLLTKEKVKGILGKFADMTRQQLQDIIQNPKSSMLEIMVASIMAKAAKDGDFSRMNFILDRSIGRVTSEDVESIVNSGTIAVTPENIAELCRLAREGSKPKPQDESGK